MKCTKTIQEITINFSIMVHNINFQSWKKDKIFDLNFNITKKFRQLHWKDTL